MGLTRDSPAFGSGAAAFSLWGGPTGVHAVSTARTTAGNALLRRAAPRCRERKIGREGVSLFGIKYWDSILSVWAGVTSQKFIIRYDPRDQSALFGDLDVAEDLTGFAIEFHQPGISFHRPAPQSPLVQLMPTCPVSSPLYPPPSTVLEMFRRAVTDRAGNNWESPQQGLRGTLPNRSDRIIGRDWPIKWG